MNSSTVNPVSLMIALMVPGCTPTTRTKAKTARIRMALMFAWRLDFPTNVACFKVRVITIANNP